MPTSLSPLDLQQRLAAPTAADCAFLDVREGGEYNEAHLAGAVLLPRSQLESRLRLVVPDPSTPLTLLDSDGRRAQLSAATAEAMGYTQVALLAGGIAAWQAAGLPVEWGSNVLSKDFGEKVQVQQHVAEVEPAELAAWQARGDHLILLDSRTPEEHTQACIPGSRSVPGGELPLRITDLLKGHEDATVVVHCAGRTRSIIGARVLQRMGIPRVYALKNGTMGWHLAGLELETGSRRTALPAPSPEARAAAAAFAQRVAVEDGVRLVDVAWLQQRMAQQGGSLYLLDTRSKPEYEAGHIPSFQWVPGGQAVQRAEDVIGVPTGDIVFCCDDGSRSAVSAGWYRQMGYPNVHLLRGGIGAWQAASGTLTPGPQVDPIWGLDEAARTAPGIPAAALDAALQHANRPLVVHVGGSREYERGHIPGAVWLARAWMELEMPQVAPDRELPIVCTCADGVQSTLAAAALARLGYANVVSLRGGMGAWNTAGLAVETGLQRLAVAADDVVRAGTERDRAAMIHYLEWEEALGGKYETAGGG